LITNRTQSITIVESEHRDHAVVEQVIAGSKTRRSRTFPPATTIPTPPGPCPRRARPQPPALNATRPTRHDRPRRTHAAPPTARRARPPDPPRTRLDAAPPRPLALARLLQARADRIRALPAPALPRPPPTTISEPDAPPGRDRRCPYTHDDHPSHAPNRASRRQSGVPLGIFPHQPRSGRSRRPAECSQRPSAQPIGGSGLRPTSVGSGRLSRWGDGLAGVERNQRGRRKAPHHEAFLLFCPVGPSRFGV
jgi:hypothetical protein